MPRFTCVLAAGVLLVAAGCGDEPAEPERAALTIKVVGGGEAYRFDTPNGLAHCAAAPAPTFVRCDIDVIGDPTRGACVLETAWSFTVGRSEAGFLCGAESTLAEDARTLAAGDRIAVGPVTCTVADERGIRCENRARHGFELRPGTHTVF